MTEKECLEKMLLVWDYLYRNPAEVKEAAYKNLKLSPDLSDCPCCEYVSQLDEGMPEDDLDCDLCSLYDLWPDTCYADNAAFSCWYYAETDAQRQAACQEIVIATKERLKTLEGDQNG